MRDFFLTKLLFPVLNKKKKTNRFSFLFNLWNRYMNFPVASKHLITYYFFFNNLKKNWEQARKRKLLSLGSFPVWPCSTQVQAWPKPGFKQISQVKVGAQVLGPPSTIFPCTVKGNQIRNGVARIPASDQKGSQNHQLWFTWPCRNAGPSHDISYWSVFYLLE